MVIEEAKILNKPVIITNTAAREALEGYKNCTIVDNSENAIYEIMKEKIKCRKNIPMYEQKYNNSYILEDITKLLEN